MKLFLSEMVKIYFGLLKTHDICKNIKSKGFLASSVSTYDYSTFYTTLPHILIKEKLTELVFHFFMEMFLASLPMVYTFRNIFVLQEYVLISMTSTIETNFRLLISILPKKHADGDK